MIEKRTAEGGRGADAPRIQIATLAQVMEVMGARGFYEAEARDANGKLLWRDGFKNLLTDVGVKHLEDNYIQASAFTQTGPYMGLISSASYGAGPAVGDTMASHGGWTEAGTTNAPTFAARLAMSWSAASGTGAGNRIKQTSSACSFTMTGAGTLKGAFLVLGSGAVTTLMNTSGTLFSAGLFSGGDKTVANNDVVNVTWSLSM